MGYKSKHQEGVEYWHADERDGLERGCGGTGYLSCYCGGDQCYCGNFGEAECFGCPDCEGERDDEDLDYPDDDEYNDLASTGPAAPAPPHELPLSGAGKGLSTTYDDLAPYYKKN